MPAPLTTQMQWTTQVGPHLTNPSNLKSEPFAEAWSESSASVLFFRQKEFMSSEVTHINTPGLSSITASSSRNNLLWVIAVSALLIGPALIYGVPSNVDLVNHFRFILPFYDALSGGNFYPSWLAESNSGYGDASFRFYPPGTYYVLALSRLVVGNWYGASIVTIAGLFILGGIGVYLWAREYVSSQHAMWAGILYGFAPYHINQIYQAFLLAEFAASAILPFVFAFAARICSRRRPFDIAGLAASYALLVLTHLPTTVISSIALGIYVLASLKPKERFKTLVCFAPALFLGLAASAFYWLQMVRELSWIRADNVQPDPSVYYGRNFLFSSLSPDNPNVWWVGILLLSTAAMFWPGLAALRGVSEKDTLNKNAPIILLLFTVFMATPLSRPVWYLIWPLQATQFPWRWLALTSMAAPVVFAMAIPFWTRMWKTNKRPFVLIAIGTMAMSFAFSAAHIVREGEYFNRNDLEKRLAAIPGSKGVSQWWPIWVKEPVKEMTTPVEAGNRVVSIKSWQPERRVFDVGPGEAHEVRAATFYYPLWVAIGNGRNLATQPAEDGALLISLPAESTTVELVFREPTRTRVSGIASIIGWTIIGLILIFGWFKRTSNDRKFSDSSQIHSHNY